MKTLRKDLNDAVKMAKALVAKVEKVQNQFAEMVKERPKMPVKKAPVKKTVAGKTVAKKAAPKKGSATATDAVLAIVNRSKKGVDSASVMKKTGFDKKKVANVFASLKKQGKIKSGDRGVYVRA